MRYSKAGFLSALLTGACLLASATPSHAFEFSPSVTDMGLLRPASGWRVNAIYVPHARYCAMADTFSKQISLAFARSPEGYGSLAIDFPGDILEAGKIYQLALQVDDGRVRQYNVHAISARSLIVQIGRDSAFYKALAGDGTLRISLPTMDMRFDLSRFAGSYISLISCADQLHHDDGPRTAAVPVQPVSATALSGGAAHVPSGNAAARQLTKAASEAQNRLARARRDETGLGDKIGILQTEKSKLATRLDMQNKQYQLLQVALQGKEKDLMSARSLSEKNSKALKEVKSELASLRQENADQVKALKAQLKMKSAQYNDIERKFIVAEATAKSARDQETQDEADLAFIRQQLAQTQERLVAVELEKKNLTSQMASQTQKNETAFRNLQEQLSKARAKIAGLESKVTSAEAQAVVNPSSIDINNKSIQSVGVSGISSVNLPPTPLVEQPPVADGFSQGSNSQNGGTDTTLSHKSAKSSGIFSFFPFSLFHHGNDRHDISSSKNSHAPAIVPTSQGQNGLSPGVSVLNASDAGAASAADPLANWKTVIIQ